MQNDSSKEMIELIKELIRYELAKLDRVIVCQIEAVNDNGTYDVVVIPKTEGYQVQKGVKTPSYMDLSVKDYVYCLVIKGQLNNMIILSKIGAADAKRYVDESSVGAMIKGALKQYVPSLPGSDSPIVNKSYVDSSVRDAKSYCDSQIDAIDGEVQNYVVLVGQQVSEGAETNITWRKLSTIMSKHGGLVAVECLWGAGQERYSSTFLVSRNLEGQLPSLNIIDTNKFRFKQNYTPSDWDNDVAFDLHDIYDWTWEPS